MEWKTSDRDAREEKVPKLRASLPCRVESSISEKSTFSKPPRAKKATGKQNYIPRRCTPEWGVVSPSFLRIVPYFSIWKDRGCSMTGKGRKTHRSGQMCSPGPPLGRSGLFESKVERTIRNQFPQGPSPNQTKPEGGILVPVGREEDFG